MKIFFKFKKKIQRFFQEYFKNIFPKIVTKAIKKQADVACVISFAPSYSRTSTPHLHDACFKKPPCT
jgi:hypothetical protein